MPTTTPTIPEILTLIPSDVRAVRVFEILTIYWQGGIRTRHYSDGRWVEDFPALTTFGFDVIDARFARNNWFVELPRTTEISDDTVKLKMWDADAVLISEFLNSGEGTRVRVAQYFPDYNLVNEIWWGFLKQPNETEGLWFNIDAASGLRSPNLIVPRRAIYPGCQAIFGGLLNPDTGTPYFDTAPKIAANDCPYDRHIGGSYGTLQGSTDPNPGQPYTTCPRRVPDDCKRRLGLETSFDGAYHGYHLSYMAFDVVLEDVDVGAHKTHLPIFANDNVLRKPLRVVYGQTWVRDLILLAYVSESYGDTPQNGFLRTLWAVCEGPIVGTPEFWPGAPTTTDQTWSGFVVNGQYVLHGSGGGDTWGLGGNPRQRPTSFSNNVLNYPNTSIMYIAYGRADFRNFNPDGFEGACQIQGKKNVKIYTSGTAFTPGYTTNRAWCLLDLYTNRRYGLGLDVSRFVIQDWIDLSNYCTQPVSSIDETGNVVTIPRTTFNGEITEGKWSDHLNDICLAGMFTLPYYHQGKLRIEPLEVGVPTSPPIFSDEDSAPSITVANQGFESPVVGTGGYYYNPAGSAWTFSGQSGVAGNGSPFVGTSPEGVQAAFIQGSGSTPGTISQPLSGFVAGSAYQIRFKTAQRPAYAGQFDVFMDAVNLGTIVPTSSSSFDSITIPFSATATSHTLKFKAWTSLGDATIDDVQITTPGGLPPAAEGTYRNIIFNNNQSTLTYSRESDSKIPNQIKVNFNDAQYQNQSRPLVLNDDVQQMKAGVAAGDQSSRPVTKEYNAVGTDNMAEAYRMAKRILDLGPFEQGGIINNFKIKFTTWSLLSDVLGLHPYSIIRVVSQTVNRFEEASGYPYEYFRIQKLTRKANLQMEIEAQLFPRAYNIELSGRNPGSSLRDFEDNNQNYPPAPAKQNDGKALLGAPEVVNITALSADPGTIHFTLTVTPRP